MRIWKTFNCAAEKFCIWTTEWTGSTMALTMSIVLIIGWLITGPFYDYSDSWQLSANTVTTLVEFVMVFVLQRAQNKDTHDIHAKLDKIVKGLNKEDKQ